jgi:hypothetical protein
MSVTELDAELAQRVELLSSTEHQATAESFRPLPRGDWPILIGLYVVLPVVVALAVLV